MNSVWKVRLTAQAVRDLQAIQRHLVESYIRTGQDTAPAVVRAEKRTRFLRKQADRLETVPHRGTRHDHWLPGLRSATFDELEPVAFKLSHSRRR